CSDARRCHPCAWRNQSEQRCRVAICTHCQQRERPFAKDIFGSVYDIMCEMEWLRNDVHSGDSATSSKEVPLCLTGTVSKICWRFCTDTLRRRLTRLRSIVVALSMATCQWDLKSTAWTTRVNSLL